MQTLGTESQVFKFHVPVVPSSASEVYGWHIKHYTRNPPVFDPIWSSEDDVLGIPEVQEGFSQALTELDEWEKSL